MAEKKEKKTTKKLKELISKNKDKIDYLTQFVFVVVIYGLLVSFILYQIFSFEFTIKNILAWGVVSYLVKAELPVIISGCFPKKPPMITQ